MKASIKMITAAAAMSLLAGCATNQQTGEAVGAVAGGIIGHQVGGGLGQAAATVIGASVGAAVGGAVGRDMDEQQRQAHRAPIYDAWSSPYPQCDRYHYNTQERTACERGARQREFEEQRRRNNEAYRQGLGR